MIAEAKERCSTVDHYPKKMLFTRLVMISVADPDPEKFQDPGTLFLRKKNI